MKTSEKRYVEHTFAPIVDKDCVTLILGSVPSVKSMQAQFYYMHPQNRFWKVLSALFAIDFVEMDNDGKRKALLERHIALYDSVFACNIVGSSDGKISDIVMSDIPKLLTGSEISRIFCNGAQSFDLLVGAFPELKSMTTKLPSTSPANAIFSLEKLTEKWKVIIE
ncbi:MAG: DNA-deoxyinosine glycosylase [Clostridia bacterium]